MNFFSFQSIHNIKGGICLIKQKTYGKFILPLVNIVFSMLFYFSIFYFQFSFLTGFIFLLFIFSSIYFGMYYDNTIIKSTKDYLTKTYNRSFANEYLQLLSEQHKREHVPFSIILIDLDSFKYINDTYGHTVGDQVLVYVSDILRQSTRKMDSVCRLGGDEFLIICPNTNKEQAETLKKRIKENFKKSKKEDRAKYRDYYNKASYHFNGISFGICEFLDSHDTIKSFIDDADKQMYDYKKLHKEIRTKVDEEIKSSLNSFKKDKSSY